MPIDAETFTAEIADRTRRHRPIGWMVIARVAWLLLVAVLLSALLVSALLIGGQPAEDRAVLLMAFEPMDASAVAVSPYGALVAAADGTDVLLLDVDTGDVRGILPSGAGAGDRVWGIAWWTMPGEQAVPDGRRDRRADHFTLE